MDRKKVQTGFGPDGVRYLSPAELSDGNLDSARYLADRDGNLYLLSIFAKCSGAPLERVTTGQHLWR